MTAAQKEHISEIKCLLADNKKQKAVEKYRVFINKFPLEPWGYRNLALTYLKRWKCYPDAAQIAEEGLKHHPDDFLLRKALAEALSHISGEEDRTERLLIGLIKETQIEEVKTKLSMTYADFLVRKRNYSRAQEIYRTLIKRNSNDIRAKLDLARSYRFSKDFDKCIEVLDEISLDNDPYWLREKGNCLLDAGRSEEAIEQLSKAKQIAKDWPKFKIQNMKDGFLRRTNTLLAAAHTLKGDWKQSFVWFIEQSDSALYQPVYDAILKRLFRDENLLDSFRYFSELLQTYPKNLYLGQTIDRIFTSIYSNTKDIDLNNIESILSYNENNPYVPIIYARLNQDDSEKQLYYLSRCWETINQFKKKATLKNAVTQTLLLHAKKLRMLNKPEESITLIEEIKIEYGVDYWEIELEKAISLAILDSFPEAYEILNKIGRLKPQNPVILDQMGICLRSMGRLNEALDLYKRKLKHHPKDIHGLYGYGKTLFELGSHDGAEKTFKSILKRNPNDLEAKLYLSQIYQQKERFKEAETVLEGLGAFDVMQAESTNPKTQRKLVELERQKEQQQQVIEEAKKLSYLGTMATAVAHEINQPVGIIRATVSSTIEDLKDGLFNSEEELSPLLSRIWAQTERLNAIIENFRRFARGDRTHKEKVDMNLVVEHVASLFEEQLRQRNIKFLIKLWDGPRNPYVWGNPYQIEEVLINLITNARDAISKANKPHIWVRVWRRKGGGINFVVEDNGPGISEEQKKNLFVPFHSTKGTEEGTGLGLYISRRILDGHNGSLQYKDRRNGGASFTVSFQAIRG